VELVKGNVAVVTGGASGIGFALAERFARDGLNVVVADVQDDALAAATERLSSHGVEVLGVKTDVSVEAEVQALAAKTLERFGAVHVVCNNAGVGGRADAWFGPLSLWEWVLGVNLWGVIHGVRAFLPHLLSGGHIVNTSSMAGLMPGAGPAYDASKHAVVALSEDLYNQMHMIGLPVGVSVLCPGWVRTSILDSERNWPARLGEVPASNPIPVLEGYVRRAIEEGATPAAMADAVADAVTAGRFWVIPDDRFLDLAVRRWHMIADRLDPDPPDEAPGMPPRSQIMAEVMAAMSGSTEQP
jgi:NAD(P)-dependent dehydrogenase (short-subunit alcohol dehydrogenase family)